MGKTAKDTSKDTSKAANNSVNIEDSKFDKTIDRFVERMNVNELLRILFLMAICLCGVLMRSKVFDYESRDVRVFLRPWYEYFQEHGGFKAVGDDIGDYTPLYYYFMAALTYTSTKLLVGLKVFSILFDFVIALYAMKIVELKEKNNAALPCIAFAVVFCLPTVVLNSAVWAQCDVIYSAFLVMCLYYILRGNDKVAMIMFGIAFAFKLQAIFFAPFIGILLMKKKIRWRSLLWIPAVYVISIIPAVMVGGDFKRLLTVYFRQSGQYDDLCMSLPNLWALWEGVEQTDLLGPAGIFFAGAAVLSMMYYYISKKELKITQNTTVALAMLSAFIVPMVLPHMHERYFYLPEVLIVIFAFYYKNRLWVVAVSQFCSVQALSRYLFGQDYMDIRFLALLEIVNLIVVFMALRDEMAQPRDEKLKMDFEKAS